MEQKSEYVCSVCGKRENLGFTAAQFAGWWWERRVGHIYDYFCPAHTPKNAQHRVQSDKSGVDTAPENLPSN